MPISQVGTTNNANNIWNLAFADAIDHTMADLRTNHLLPEDNAIKGRMTDYLNMYLHMSASAATYSSHDMCSGVPISTLKWCGSRPNY